MKIVNMVFFLILVSSVAFTLNFSTNLEHKINNQITSLYADLNFQNNTLVTLITNQSIIENAILSDRVVIQQLQKEVKDLQSKK